MLYLLSILIYVYSSWQAAFTTHINLLFSQRPYVRKRPSISDEFLLEEHFEREMQLKKFTTRRKLALFFFPSRAPLSRWETARESGHSVCELLTIRSCIRCTRCIHTHTPGHLVAHCTNEHAKFPHRRDERIFAIGCSNPVGPPSTTWEVSFRKLIRTKKILRIKKL